MTKGEKKRVVYTCGRCNRRLRDQRWVYSTFSGQRFCLPGEGCQKGVTVT